MYTSPRLCGIFLIADQNNCTVLVGCLEIRDSAHIQHTTGMLERLEAKSASNSFSSLLANKNASARTAGVRSGRITGDPEVIPR
jgi:hypothetical protein